jgi:penicillin amidase
MRTLLVAVAVGLAVAPSAPRPHRVGDTAMDVPGLTAPVEIRTDRWGVAHIYAATVDDAFFGQGFQAARDRLWQMDLWRRRGLGEMAKDFGPAYAEGDRMARAFLFRGDMDREWAAYGPDSERVATAFVAGVNAFVAATESRPELLPVEFRLMAYTPARWTASDVVRIRHHGLTLNFSSEVDRAAAYCAGMAEGTGGQKVDWLRRELVPAVTPVVPEGLDVCTVPAAELRRAYALATATPQFGTGGSAPSASTMEDRGSYGSNNWTIAPSRTTTGRPILANDPHRAHGAPSLRYISHIVAPGLDVIGAGEPFLPGLSIGHNGTVAFGLTRFYIDQEDLYVYETSPQDLGQYRYQGRFEPMTILHETIEVKGEAPRAVTIKITRHGPVLYEDEARHRAYALRAAWLEPGMAPYFGSVDYMRARNWAEFHAAMNRWGAPAENQVYADTSGNIGWIPGGLTPIRPNWDGLLPVPGDGRYEWAGFRDRDELPSELNPARGYVVTANENNIPAGHPAASKGVGYEWSDAARSQRLQALFAAKDRFSVADSERMQTDTVSMHAQRITRLLPGLHSDDRRVAEALQRLRAWDGDEGRDSVPAAIFEVWFGKHLRPAVLAAALGETAARAAPGDPARILLLLENPAPYLTPEQRDRVLVSSLGRALDELTALRGEDMGRWQWGALHQAEFEHPLQAIVDSATAKTLAVGRWPLGGSASTPMATGYRPRDFTLTGGASFRMVLDVGAWDSSRVVNAPGQSGDPRSPHYRDLAPLWAEGGYFPLLYTRSAVEAATESLLRLRPLPASPVSPRR